MKKIIICLAFTIVSFISYSQEPDTLANNQNTEISISDAAKDLKISNKASISEYDDVYSGIPQNDTNRVNTKVKKEYDPEEDPNREDRNRFIRDIILQEGINQAVYLTFFLIQVLVRQ